MSDLTGDSLGTDVDAGTIYVPLSDLNATEALARQLAPCARAGMALALRGDLGAGKTSFARAFLQNLGITGEIPSPTFTLVQSYEFADGIAHHFDLYRLNGPHELGELGWEDLLAEAICLIEWPDRAAERLPPSALDLHFVLDQAGLRSCRITLPFAEGSAWHACLMDLA